MSDETWNVIELAEFAADGAWPIAGGILDQSANFVEAVRRFKIEEGKHKQ